MDETSRCGNCGIEKPSVEFYVDRSKATGRHSICKECVKADRRRRYAADPAKYNALSRAYAAEHRDEAWQRQRAVRQGVLDAYGNACACCGETTPEFLGVDHVNNDGEAHRRELKGYGRAIYQWLRSEGYPQDGRFQLLCHNCNMAKGCYGGCPHQGVPPGRRRVRAA